MMSRRKIPTHGPWWTALLLAALGACAARTEEPASPTTAAPTTTAASIATAPPASPSPSTLPPQVASATTAAPPSSSSPLAERTTAEKARAVFDQRCASCHVEGVNAKAEKHFKLDHGVLAGHHAGSLGKTVRQVLGMNGGKATMPPGGPALSPEEAQLLASWADEQDRTAPKHHEGHTH